MSFNETTTISPSNLSNVSTSSPADDDLRAKTKALYLAMYGVIMFIVCIFGIVGNALNIIVFSAQRLRVTNLRPSSSSPTYVLLLHLAIADLLALVFWLPEITRLGWYIGVEGFPFHSTAVYYAHASFPLINAFITWASLLALILSYERYVAVCHPLRTWKFGLATSRRANVFSVVALIISVSACLPQLWEYKVVDQDDGRFNKRWNADVSDTAMYKRFKIVRQVVLRYLPILLITCLNLRTAIVYRRVLSRRKRISSKSSPHQSTRVTLMLAVALQYVVCLFPVSVYHILVDTVLRFDFTFRIFTAVADLLESGNSALNFFTYVLASRDFRDKLSRAVTRRGARVENSSVEIS